MDLEQLNILGERLKEYARGQAKTRCADAGLKVIDCLWSPEARKLEIQLQGNIKSDETVIVNGVKVLLVIPLTKHIYIEFTQEEIEGKTGDEHSEWTRDVRDVPYERKIDEAIENFLVSEHRRQNK